MTAISKSHSCHRACECRRYLVIAESARGVSPRVKLGLRLLTALAAIPVSGSFVETNHENAVPDQLNTAVGGSDG